MKGTQPMEILLVIAIAAATSLTIGYLYGRNQIDPDTPEGREYYG
jgi:hypothetical protein